MRVYHNYAKPLISFNEVQSGQDLICGNNVMRRGLPAAAQSSPNLPKLHYLEGCGYEDIAVITLASFGVGRWALEQDDQFRDGGFELLRTSLKAGKKRLVIDLTGNPGGGISEAYSLFKELFPQFTPEDAKRFRAHQTIDSLGAVVARIRDDEKTGTVPAQLPSLLGHLLDYHQDLDVSLQAFKSWPGKYDRHGSHGDKFSSVFRTNFSNVHETGIAVNGYGNRTEWVTTGYDEHEDIILVSDGRCSSTCAVFSDLMQHQARVKTVVLGGRPSTSRMQAVGGVKGGAIIEWSEIWSFVDYIRKMADPHTVTMLSNYSSYPVDRAAAASVNFLDMLRADDTTETPLQFQAEPADHHLFYTEEMVRDVTKVWKRAADKAWGTMSAC